MSKTIRGTAWLVICLLVVAFAGMATPVFADEPTDVIRNYTVTVDVNEDATLNIYYHLEWEVLESDGIGPVTWLKIGIPNGAYTDYKALSDNIVALYPESDGGTHVKHIDSA